MSAPLTRELIVEGQIVEGAALEFKQQIDVDDARQKSNLIDDVVAFLNARAGHIVVGVRERRGAYDGFSPLQGDPEQRCRKILSILQDNIDPRPMQLEVRSVSVEGGFLLDIDIPEHVMRPYQNRLNGAFYLRTGAKNTPIPRQELSAHFITAEHYEQDLARLLDDAMARLAKRDSMISGAATLDVGILPRAYYERGRPIFHRGGPMLKPAPLFHYGDKYFEGCEGGHEATEIDFSKRLISRTYLGNDWFLHAHIVYPIGTDNGGHTKFLEFRNALGVYLGGLSSLLDGEKVGGPFCVQFIMRGLSRDEKLSWLYPNIETVMFPRGAVVERLDDPETLDAFCSLVRAASRLG
ncbi:MAG: ATP-binding protein [Caulobacter sp.]